MVVSRPTPKEKGIKGALGAESEAVIAAALIQAGYTVLTPNGYMHRYDLVIEDANGDFWRIQCKTAWFSKDKTTLRFNGYSMMYKGQRGRKTLYCQVLFEPILRQEKNGRKERGEMSVSKQKAVCHDMCMYGMKICHVNDAHTAVCVVRHAQLDRHLAMEAALGSSAGMVLLSQLKRRRLIPLSTDPHRKDDSDPHMRKRPYGNGVAFAFRSFALIVVLGPRFTLGGLPRKLMQGVAQRFNATQAAMRFAIHATLIENWRGSSQCLQTACILVPLTIIPNLSQQPWSQVLPSTRQTLKEGVILMGQKKGVDLFVIVSNLLHEWQQLARWGQHQARFRASEDHIPLHLRLVQPLDHPGRGISWMGMPRVFELLLNLVKRSGSCGLKGWIGLQEHQRTLLVQLREQIQSYGILRFQARRELIDQTRLRADQGILVPRQLLEFCHLVTIGSQSMQICEIGAPGLGQQVRIDQIGLGTTGRSPTIHGARIDWVHRPARLQEVDNQQTMSGFNTTCHVLFRRTPNDLHQKIVQLGKSLWSMINTNRTHLMPFVINRQSIVVLVRPVNTAIPHQKLSSRQRMFLSSRALLLWRSKRDSLMIGSAQEPGKAKCELSQSVEPCGEPRLSPSVFNTLSRTSVLLFQPCVEWACS
jgi:hypothetical protein